MAQSTHWEGEPVAVWRAMWGVPVFEAYDSLPSTNDRARELCARDLSGPAVVVANAQTAGRGRGASAWLSDPGCGLWLSAALPNGGQSPHLPLLVGLRVARAVEAETGLDVGIEWPNDLLVEGRKVCGILCEGSGTGVVVGVGLNLHPPAGGFGEDLSSRAGALSNFLPTPPAAGRLASGIVASMKGLDRTLPPAISTEDLGALRERDTLLNRPVRTTQSGTGVARGIRADGALLLERADGVRIPVVAGSVRAVASMPDPKS